VYDEVRNRPLSLISQVHRAGMEISTPMGVLAVQNGSFAVPAEGLPNRGVTRAA
jgi:hypothetical protein